MTKHFFITYVNDQDGQRSFVRVILKNDCDLIDLEVNFAGMQNVDMDATISFTTNVKNEGTFFTDSNGLGIVKRTKKEDKSEFEFLSYEAPANYYPINTAIFIDDESS